jgi:hypothetical protein
MTPDQVKESFYKTTFTLKGRIFFPNILKTRTKTTPKGAREVYDVQFAWLANDPANAQTIAAMNAFLQQVTPIVHSGVDPRALVIPVKDFNTYQRQDYKPNPDYLKGCKWVNAESGSEFPPQVVDQNRQPIFNEAEVYSGRNAVVNIQFYPMLPKQDAAPGSKRGYGVNLNAVMLLDGGDREGGRAAVDVNSIFGGFQSDMAPMGNSPINNGPQNSNVNTSVNGNQTTNPFNSQPNNNLPPFNGNGGGFI